MTKHGEPLAFLYEILDWDREECTIWPYTQIGNGYGRLFVRGKRWSAHRWVCEKVHGPCPEDKSQAAHSCGVRACVNPNHLRWATAKENEADKFKHGTYQIGMQSPRHILNDAQVLSILEDNRTLKTIATEYGVSISAVHHVKSGKNWSWITGIQYETRPV